MIASRPACHRRRPVWAGLSLGLAIATASCANAGPAATPGTVRVYKSLGTVQCADGGTDLPTLARQLEGARLKVLGSACGTDGRVRPAMCGAADGRIAIFTLSADDARSASALGFGLLSSLPEARELPCR